MSQTNQEVEIYLANEGSGLAFFGTDLDSGINIGIEFGVMLRVNEPHRTEIAHNVFRIHSHDIH